MHAFYDIKDMLKRELEEIARTGELSAGSLDTVDKLLHSIKNACKIIMYEEYAEGGNSYGDADMDMSEYSNARGRGSNARRDSRGRYSREGGQGGGSSSRGGRSYRSGYAYGDDTEEKVELLREMMKEASNEEERRALQKLIRRVEQG